MAPVLSFMQWNNQMNVRDQKVTISNKNGQLIWNLIWKASYKVQQVRPAWDCQVIVFEYVST